MTVYHGSQIIISKPDTAHSRPRVDFGKGFYTTPLYDQAEKWCGKFTSQGLHGIISVFEFDETAYKKCRLLRFDTYSEQWLDFIINCRTGKDSASYEIVEGGVANDKVFNTIELYFDGLINKTEAIKRLQYEKPNCQICFKTQTVIDTFLHFTGSIEL